MCGLPVITNETGDMHRWITAQSGIILPTNNIGALTNAMHELVGNVYEAKLIRQSVIDRCSNPTVRNQLMTIYQDALITDR